MPPRVRCQVHDDRREARVDPTHARGRGRRSRRRTRRGSEGRGFCGTQWVKSAPPLPTSNRYQALSVDSTTNNESETCLIRAAQPSTPKIRRKKWERRLPAKYIIAADSTRSLSVDVEIEATDSALRRLLKALIDCGATGLFIDSDYVRTKGIATRALSQPIPVYNVDGTA